MKPENNREIDVCPFFNVTRGLRDLYLSPSKTETGDALIYGMGVPFQLSREKAGILAQMKPVPGKAADFENGVDFVLFDNLNSIKAENAIPVSRNYIDKDPATGRSAIMVHYPIIGGFVPLGAKLSDGRPHPHAGTGFGVNCVISFPVEGIANPGSAKWTEFSSRWLQIRQFAFDGENFSVGRTDLLTLDQVLAGWIISSISLSCAIPDDEDLLFCMVGGKKAGLEEMNRLMSTGVMRWKHGEKGWYPDTFTPVVTDITSSEPSMVRDTDGALLFCTRPENREFDYKHDIFVWRSGDSGKTWEQIIHLKGKRARSPVSINMTAGGIPFVAGNLYASWGEPDRKDDIPGASREILCLWPLKADRTGLESPVFARVPRLDFGPPVNKHVWHADHPISNIVRLADGRLHTLLAYRLTMGWWREPPVPYSGCFVEEITTGMPDSYEIWRF